MTDIVEQLRHLDKWRQESTAQSPPYSMFGVAAAEIELLRAELDCRSAGAGLADISGNHCPLDRLCARCREERLRAELEAARRALRFANSLIHGRPNDWPGEHKAIIDAAMKESGHE